MRSFHIEDKIKTQKYDIIFCCVGPNESKCIAHKFKKAKVLISCENDYFSPHHLKKMSKNKRIYFGIPDVITSNTAPKELLKKDELTTVTERGILILEKGKYNFPKKITQVDKKNLDIHWRAKLFIHNAPHAILAYLGFLKKYKYIHEAMSDKKIRKIVVGSMNEITEGLIKAKYVPKNFAEKYKKKKYLDSKINCYLIQFQELQESRLENLEKKIELYYHCDLLKEINYHQKILLLE